MDVIKPLVGTLIIICLFGCQVVYLSKSAINQADILWHRVPISKVLEDTKLDERTRSKLNLTLKVRTFASENLKLNVKENYSTYVDLKRPYVVWAVNAAPPWALENHLWHFPIVGSVPYKGFPSEFDAKAEAEDLKGEGLDTYIRGVRAYSTLGWFSDPILSPMIAYDDSDLVNTVIHESTHATIFIKNNAEFNERLASFIGDKGTELFYLQIEGSDSIHIKSIKDASDDQKVFSRFISNVVQRLKIFYKTHPIIDFPLRELEYEKIKTEFKTQIQPQLKTNDYTYFTKLQLNNARLMLFKTYIEDIEDFEKLFQKTNGNMAEFINKIKSLETHANPIDGLKKLL